MGRAETRRPPGRRRAPRALISILALAAPLGGPPPIGAPPAVAASSPAQPAPAAAPSPPPAVFDPTLSDPQAVAIADLVMGALGGLRAWEGTRYIRFAFAVDRDGKRVAYRTHLWDRYAGRLRFEPAPGADGEPVVVLLDVDSRHGGAWRGGERLPEAAAKPLLEEAYEAWINDTYWLLMPYKMKDPGVHLRYGGVRRNAGAECDIIELSFDKVGLTPGDRYWAEVNRETRLVDRWSYILQDDPPGSRPTVWDWKGWTRRGSLMLAPEKVSVRKDGTVKITHPVMDVYDALPEEYFSSPDPLPAVLASSRG